MTNANTTAILTIEIAASQSAPKRIELLPAGPGIKARDGRTWKLEDPGTVVTAFEAHNGPLVIDYEHGQHHKAKQGEMAPAAGWITGLTVRGGAVWADVEWTDKAAAMITAREYRFISPEFNFDEQGNITRLRGAGLVNRPALELTALSRQQENGTMNFKAIAKKLELPEDADEAAILAELDKRGAFRAALCKELGLDDGSDDDAVTAGLTKLKSEHETAIASVKDSGKDKVPVSELTAVAAELKESKGRIAELEKQNHDRDVVAALDAAAAEGKITPASRDQYKAMCADADGLERFKALAGTLPVICEPSKLGGREADTITADDTRDPVEIAALAKQYQKEQEALGLDIPIETAVAHVMEKKK